MRQLRDELRESIECAHAVAAHGKELYISTLLLPGKPTEFKDVGDNGFSFQQGGVTYTIQITEEPIPPTPMTGPQVVAACCRLRATGWIPYRLARHRDGTLLELVTYPFDGGDEPTINARTPGDPMTVRTFFASEFVLLQARCERDWHVWVPDVVEGTGLDRESHIDCPKCGRGYYLNEAKDAFVSDRTLTLLEVGGN